MSNDATPAVSDGHQDVWAALSRQGYALTGDQSIGLSRKFQENFSQAYFNDWTLHHHNGDWPVDRLRARDVIRYQWHNEHLTLQRHDTITITDRGGIAGKREHARVELLDDRQTPDLIHAFLQLVPPGRRQSDGTFGINLFRTFNSVVTTPHHDDEEFIIIYVLDRVGDGAETYLYRPSDVTEGGEVKASPVLRQQLNPGDIIIFDDKAFKHGTTPLTNPVGRTAQRDALVCTVDYHATYLAT